MTNYKKEYGITKLDALLAVWEDAYAEAVEGVGLAPIRMVGYKARRLAEARYGIPADEFVIAHNGDTGHAWRTYQERYPISAAAMNIVQKARGRGYEPHTNHRIDFGTVEVRNYVRFWHQPHLPKPTAPSIYPYIDTSGPAGRYQGILLIEKDGLLEVLMAAEIGERYDLMVASTEGYGVEAVRELAEQLTILYRLPIYLLHDFDISGVLLAAALDGRDTKSWTWRVQPTVINLGIQFEDIEEYEIADETVSGEDDWIPLLEELGLDNDAIEYLVSEQWQEVSSRKNRPDKIVTHWRGRRAELNGLGGREFIEYIEAKLEEAGVGKLIPDDDLLAETYRHGVQIAELNGLIGDQIEKLVEAYFTKDGERPEIEVPADLRERIEAELDLDPTNCWDAVLFDLIPDGGDADA